MKAVFVVYFAVLAVCSAEWRIQTAEDLAKHRTKCVEELKIEESAVTEYKKWNFTDDEKTRCYIKCIFNQMELFSDETGYNVEHLVEQLGQTGDKEKVREQIVKCVDDNPNKDDKCTWVFRGFNCFKANHLSLIKQSLKKD
ncbi:general odorant-binding protein 99a-like [Lutzomyia longipalpis]|uniref:Proteinral odorant-binding protein 99a n=1 Tax=Lutzomyia longipalpis TaxID=7200 RepID=A0A1B0EW76_LUTLO|nr:general odorant-binding protein 99a-like [Lutzomyia longipalpis]